MQKSEIVALTSAMMHIARELYPSLDPSLLVLGVLHCRKDDAAGWKKASNAAAIAAAGKIGSPLAEIVLAEQPFARLRSDGPLLSNENARRAGL